MIKSKEGLIDSIYGPLAFAYFQLRKKEELENLLQDFAAKRPNCEKGKHVMQKLLDKLTYPAAHLLTSD